MKLQFPLDSSRSFKMIFDARDCSVGLDRNVTVAIVGAGPCGLTIARELAVHVDVLLIESGGINADVSVSALQKGRIAGLEYPLETTRERRFGGSSYLWAGYCALFDKHDFERRPWVPESGWPIGHDEVARYYPKAAETLNLGDCNFDAVDISLRARDTLLVHKEGFSPTVWRFGMPIMRFGDAWRTEFEARDNPTTVTHANLVDIRIDAVSGRVDELVIRTLGGREGRVRADVVILACGGIETARLLLNADSQTPGGVGNSHDLVGRYFMEHPHLTVPGVSFEPADWHQTWTAPGEFDGGRYAYALGISPRSQRELECLNARAHIFRTPEMEANAPPRLGLFMEQAPNPDSRVTLTDERDSLGVRRICLNWRLTEMDRFSYERTAERLLSAFGARAAMHFDSDCPRSPDSVPLLHSNHHLGTTRMSSSPRKGVVDPDCRMHDVANCYIAGGSVFPTVSWANPTMTVLALTYRLIDHLKEKVLRV